MDYGCEERRKVGGLRGDIGAIRIGFDSLYQKIPIITPQKTNRSAKRCI
jgi:hypothetical protein